MKTKNLKYLFAIALFGLFVMNSCKKEDTTSGVTVSSQEAVEAAQDDANAGDSYDEVYSESDDVVSTEESNNYSNSSNLKSMSTEGTRKVTVTKGSGDSTNYPKTITIEYSNWIGKNGRKKNGTITITQSAKMWKKNAVRTILLSDFVINDSIKIEGLKTITNKGLSNGKQTVEVTLQNGKVTNLNTNKFITREFTRTRIWDDNSTPLWIWDDTYTISGTATGVNRNGYNYTSTISDSNPLFMRVGCPWITKGVITIVVEGKKTVTIDFGTGTCDKKYTVTVDNVSTDLNSTAGTETTGL